MEDKDRFSDNFFKALKLTPRDGEAMIAISRAILQNDYSNEEYENDFFSIFILIDEESGGIILDGFGEFNVASLRHELTGNCIENTVRIMTRASLEKESYSNGKLYRDEIEDIARSYIEQFLISLCDFKAYFKLEGA
jgi:hypothetical protein